MSDATRFPRTRVDALTALFLQQQDISELTPKEFVEKFNAVHKEVDKAVRQPAMAKLDALTMLFLQQQDIGELTPKELAEKFNEVSKEIDGATRQPIRTSNIRLIGK